MASPAISFSRLKKIVDGFCKSSIMVIGDCMLDEYIWGDVRRISPEAPVPVVDVESRTVRLGGAANVVNNLLSIGVKTHLVSLCGNDDTAGVLKDHLVKAGCSIDSLVSSDTRKTTIKTRIMARQQQIVRVDNETVKELSLQETKDLWKQIEQKLPAIKGIIISDYAKGVISPPLLSKVFAACKKRKLFVAIDPKERHFGMYKGVSVITPNLKEAHAALSIPYKHCTDSEIKELGWAIVKKLSLPSLLITLSERGMALFESQGNRFTHLPTVAQTVFDVTGAGDTVIGIYSAAITCGAKPIEAAYLANHAAGLTVAQIGTACVTPDALLKACGT